MRLQRMNELQIQDEDSAGGDGERITQLDCLSGDHILPGGLSLDHLMETVELQGLLFIRSIHQHQYGLLIRLPTIDVTPCGQFLHYG